MSCKYELANREFTKKELQEEIDVNPRVIYDTSSDSRSLANTIPSPELNMMRDVISHLSNRFGVEVIYENNPLVDYAGEYRNGRIYFNEAYLVSHPDTAWHEFSHPLIDTIEITNPNLFNSLVAEVEEMMNTKGTNKAFNRIKTDIEYYDSGLTDIGRKEAIAIALGYMSKEAHDNKNTKGKERRQGLLNRVMTFLTSLFSRVFNTTIDPRELNPDMSLKDLAYLIGASDNPVRVMLVDGPGQKRKTEDVDMEAYRATGDYTEGQLDILKKINENNKAVGDPVEVPVSELPKDLQKLFAGLDTVLRYRNNKTGGVFYNRVSDANQRRMKMSVEERSIQENDPKSVLARNVGTQFHMFNEKILEGLNKEFPFDYGVHSKMSKRDYVNTLFKKFSNSAVYNILLADIQSGNTYVKHERVRKYVPPGQDEFAYGEQDYDEYGPGDDYGSHDYSQEPDDLYSNYGSDEMYSPVTDLPEDIRVNGRNTLNKLVMSMMEIYYDAHKKQESIDPTKKPLILLEKLLVDEKNDLVGSPDIMIVYSDKTGGIFDNKFINFTFAKKIIENPNPAQKQLIKNLRAEQGLVPEYSAAVLKKNPELKGKDNWYYEVAEDSTNLRKLSLKVGSYEKQLLSYSAIARDVYGIEKIVQSRIIPFAVKYDAKYNPKSKKMVYNDDTKVQFIMTNVDNARMLSMVPISRELTGNDQLDFYIQGLADKLESMQKELNSKKQWDDPEATDRYYKLKNTISALQLGSNYSFMVDNLKDLNSRIEKRLEIQDENHIDYFSMTELDLIMEEVNLYKDLLDFLTGPIKDLANSKEGEDRATNEQIQNANILLTNLGIQNAVLASNRIRVEKVLVERLMERVEDEGIMSKELLSTYKSQTDISQTASLFGHLHSINHPLIQVLAKNLDIIDMQTVQHQNELKRKMTPVMKALGEWGAQRNLYGNDVYKKLIRETKDDIKLIKPFSTELYNEARERRKEVSNNNNKWFIDTFHRSTLADGTGKSEEDRFQENKNRIDTYYRRVYKDDKEREKKMNEWLNNNDIYYNNGNNAAWYNNYIRNSYSPKNPDKWYSKEFKELLQPENKPLLDFYNLYTNEIEYINSITKAKIDRFFIPSVHRDMIEVMADTGVKDAISKTALGRMKNTLKNAWQNETTIIKARKGDEKEKSIPLFYTDSMDKENKSHDLARSLMLFSTVATEHAGLLNMHSLVKVIRSEAVKTPFVKKDESGIVKIPGSTIPETTSPEGSALVKTIDTMINYYLYKETLQEDALSKTINEKYTNSVRQFIGLTGKAQMSFHALSAAAGGINGLAQIQAMANKAKYIKPDTFREAARLVAKPGDKGKALTWLFEELQVSSEDLSRVRAAEISNSKMRRAFKEEWSYIFQRKIDTGIEQTVFNSIMLGFGIDPITKTVRPLDKLKELYPDKEFKNLYESLESKEVDGDTIWTLMDGTVPASNKTLISIKTKVTELNGRVKGQMSDRDIAGYKTSIAGRILMQYRSWIPATMTERMRSEGYNYTMEEYEIGRWRAAWRYVRSEGIRAGAKFAQLMIPFIGNNASLDLANNPKMKELYETFISQNPESGMKGSESYVSFDDFIREHEGNVRAVASELKIFYGLLLLMLSAMFILDDEDEDNPLVQGMMAVLNRSLLEIGFYLPFEPTGHGFEETTKLLTKNPIPAMGSVGTITKMLYNTVTETGDFIGGAGFDKTVMPRFADEGGIEFKERKDDTPVLKYTIDLLGLKHVAGITGVFNTTDKEDTLLDYALWGK